MPSKRIVLISTIYKTPKSPLGTAVCNYFANEWSKMGHSVLAIYLHTNYPSIFYLPAKFYQKKIAARTGAVVDTKAENDEYKFTEDCATLYQIPIYKRIPHGKYTKQSIDKAYNRICELIHENLGDIDYILGHFPNPQIEILGRLKEKYSRAKTAVIMHGDNSYLKSIYGYERVGDISNIDLWGFRSKAIMNDFVNRYGKPNKSFICYSGIPEYYLKNIKKRDYTIFSSFIFVGELIDRKYPDILIDALDTVYENNSYTLRYVGNGARLQDIENKRKRRENIKMLGKLPRAEVINYIDQSDCMIMISRGEAFGLVYIEAMARGCIVVASRNEGVDGIIIDGENGFLCAAGDTQELALIVSRISSLSPEERRVISEKAMSTAAGLTDKLVAERYLNDIANL